MSSSWDARVGDVSAMDGGDARVVLEEWNETVQPYPALKAAPALFEAQASRAPESTALVFEGVEVSYGELLRMTGRLAQRLVEGEVEEEAQRGGGEGRSASMWVLRGITRGRRSRSARISTG